MNGLQREELNSQAVHFSFFQWVRIWLEHELRENPGRYADLNEVMQELQCQSTDSLGFPAGDIAEAPSPNFLILNFMGLYGASSPLPSFFTSPIDRQDERFLSLKRFLDVFNNRLYSLFFQAWLRSHYAQWMEYSSHLGRRKTPLESLACLMHAQSLNLAGMGAFVSKSRSVADLKRVLKRCLGYEKLQVNALVVTREPSSCLLKLGSSILDGNGSLGDSIEVIGNQIHIRFQELSQAAYESFLNGLKDRFGLLARLRDVLRSFLPYAVRVDLDVEMHLNQNTDSWLLGDQERKLGSTTWIGNSHYQPPEAKILLDLQV